MMKCSMVSLAFGLWLVSSAATAQPAPVGRWKTIDDHTGEARSIVAIYEQEGKLYGRIEEILLAGPDAPRNDAGVIICSVCEGERHNQPVEGMVILWDLEKDGDQWAGGRVLDPESGNVYRAKLWLDDHRLKLRGYLGISLLGRTQTWLPVSEEESGSE